VGTPGHDGEARVLVDSKDRSITVFSGKVFSLMGNKLAFFMSGKNIADSLMKNDRFQANFILAE
jgi:hypothetical protein